MSLYLDDGDVRLYHGDALAQLAAMPAESVQCIVTSPPFWALRDYGVDGQIGLEATPDEWCARLVAVFRECRRVLRNDGVMWIEVGDTYAGSWGNQGRKEERGTQRPVNGGMLTPVHDGRYPAKTSNTGAIPEGVDFKPKDLVGAPWMLAFALRADGWYLRSDTIWARPNPMPESVTDRPTKAHSYVFLLTKQARYFYDADAIREPHQLGPNSHSTGTSAQPRGGVKGSDGKSRPSPAYAEGERTYNPAGRNARSVWSIATEPTPFAHFATFPQALVERCIKAGTSEYGACIACGSPWARDVHVESRPNVSDNRGKHDGTIYRTVSGGVWNDSREKVDNGWVASCDCKLDPPVRPCVVLDPFMGSGTTALVARRLGRHAVGIELNADYLKIAATRLQQLSLLGDAS